MTELRKKLPSEMEAFAGDFHGLLDQIGIAGGRDFLRDITPFEPVTDLASLQKFLQNYATTFLYPIELSVICKAYSHAARYECRELIALDQELSNDPNLQRFGNASSQVGRTHLLNLRPLRENRFVQRYLAALDAGDAQAWHTLVYGISLSIYSVPLRQGLLVYTHLVLDGFAQVAGSRLSLSPKEVRAVVDEIAALAPKEIDSLLNAGENLFKAA
ncbi:MAG: hypothetical protein H0X66_12600 [Verrucomicrobia bacterium]|nr:hypothetical protein [Verrucomicrobiota bacterium]